MAKRIFAALIMVGVFVAPVSVSYALESDIGVDGCTVLARAVYDEVHSTVSNGPGRSGPWSINIGGDEISVCKTASRTVSRAFTSAMQSAGVKVSWGGFLDREWDWPDSGGFCLSHFLSQCYPENSALGNGAVLSDSRHDMQKVQERWLAVSEAVRQQMYNPHSSNEVQFRDSDLRLRLGLSLRSISVAQLSVQTPD